VRPSYESLIDATVLNFAFSQRFPISFIHECLDTMDSDRSKTEVRDDDLDDDYNPGNNDSSDEENNPFNDYNETEKKSVGKLNLAQLKELLQKEYSVTLGSHATKQDYLEKLQKLRKEQFENSELGKEWECFLGGFKDYVQKEFKDSIPTTGVREDFTDLKEPIDIFKALWDSDIVDGIIKETNKYSETKSAESKNNCKKSKSNKDILPEYINSGDQKNPINLTEDNPNGAQEQISRMAEDKIPNEEKQKIPNVDSSTNQKKEQPNFITNEKLFEGFLGASSYMGVYNFDDAKDYWVYEHGPRFIQNNISRGQYLNHLRFLHIPEDNESPCLKKFNWLLKRLKANFKKLWNPGVYNTIDEAMIRSKSPFSGYRVYMPAKPIKWGIKVWMIVDNDGYIYDFDIYTGKKGNIEKNQKTEKDLGYSIVFVD